MSKFDRNRIKDGWAKLCTNKHTNKQTDRQTDKQTDTTKIMVTWPWTNKLEEVLPHCLPVVDQNSHCQKYWVQQSDHSGHAIVQIHVTRCPSVSDILGWRYWHQSGHNSVNGHQNVITLHDFLRQCCLHSHLVLSEDLRNGIENPRDRQHQARCNSRDVTD